MSHRQVLGMKSALAGAGLLAFFACTNDVTEVPSDTRPAKGVFGSLVDRNGVPLRGAVVKAVPGTIGNLGKASAAMASEADSTVTDSTGRYVLEGLSQGLYNLLGDYGQGQLVVLIQGVMVAGEGSRVEVRTDTLRPPGRISGRVNIPGADQGGVLCYVPGTSFLALSDDSGGYTLSGLPQGTYAVSFRKDGLKTVRKEGVEVKAGGEVRLEAQSLPADPAYPPPAPAGLDAVYDTLSGRVTLRWRKVDVSDIDGFWIYRNQAGDAEPIRITSRLVRDTVWSEQLYGPVFTDPGRDFVYRLKSQDTEANMSGVYSRPVTVRAAAPSSVRTTFAWTLDGARGDSASIGDSVLARVEYRNPSRRIARFSLYVDARIVPVRQRNDATMPGSESVPLFRASAGKTWVFAEAVDEAGTVWWDSVSVRYVADPPRVDAGRDTAVAIHSQARFQGRAAQAFGGIVLYKWDFEGDGTWDDSSATGEAAHTYHQVGIFHARLLARDDDGNESVGARRVSVSNQPPAVTALSADTMVSILDTVRFFGDGFDAEGTAATFAWDFEGDGTFDTSFTAKAAHRHVYATAGVYNALFRISDADGGATLRIRKVTVILDAPVADAGMDTAVSIKDSVRLRARGSDGFGSIVAWDWDVGGTGLFRPASGRDTIVTAPSGPSAGWIAVLRATDDDGNQDLDTVSIAVLLDAPAVNAGKDTTVPVGQDVTLQGTASQRYGTFVMYYWDWHGDGIWDDSSGTRLSTSLTVALGGTRKAVFGARDDDGNLASDTIVVSGVSYVGGIVAPGSPTLFTRDKSPYVLTADLQVPSGVTLSLAPGAVLSGEHTVLIKGGALIAAGTVLDSVHVRCQVRFEGTDLAGSRIEYARFSGVAEALRIGVESEHQQAPIKNSNRLVVANSDFRNTGIITDGYASTASLYLHRITLEATTVHGTYPRSEPIILRSATILKSTLFSDSYNEGITLDSATVSDTKLKLGCCGSNFRVSASNLVSSSITTTNSEGFLEFSRSELANTTIDLPNGGATIADTRVRFTGMTPLVKLGYGTIVRSRFQGPGNGTGVLFTGYQYSSLSDIRVDSTEFRDFGTGLKVQDFRALTMSRNNFIANGVRDLENESARAFTASNCYWNGAASAATINARILDGGDDLNRGVVTFTPFVTVPYPY